MLKLLIADGTEEFRLALAEHLTGSYVVRCCHQGKQTMEMIHTFKPDVLVLDLMLPELDGISLLQRLAEEGNMPVVLATTRMYTDYVVDALTKLGVGYLMIKPCDLNATVARIRDLSERIVPVSRPRPDLQTTISNVLLSMGFPAKLHGFTYLREAIEESIRNPGQLVTKELYPLVGKRCRASWEQVERSIRNAIATAYRNRNEQIWQQYFEPGADNMVERPSNGTFINTLAARLRDHSRV